METNRKILLLCGIVIFYGVVSAFGEIVSPNAYEVGCGRVYEDIVSGPDLIARILASTLPSCVDDVFWRHYQCNRDMCYCSYVDTGNPISMKRNRMELFMSFDQWNRYCPVRFQNQADGCELPKGHYPCEIDGPRYIYNSKTQKCEVSPNPCYGFDAIEDCRSKCVPTTYDSCSFPRDKGQFCGPKQQQQVLRFYYASNIGQCLPFYYKGCGGNSNNYQEMWQCERSCKTESMVPMLLRVESKKLYNVSLPLWMILKHGLNVNETNNVSKKVFQDIQTSAENVHLIEIIENVSTKPPRPLTEEEINRRDFKPQIVCSQPAKTGFCRAYIPRWYYDQYQSKCVKFVYGGCTPNGNNFEDWKECTSYCNAPYTPSPLERIQPPQPGAGNPPKGVTGSPPPPTSGNVQPVQEKSFKLGTGEILYQVPLGKGNSQSKTKTTKTTTSTSTSVSNASTPAVPETTAAVPETTANVSLSQTTVSPNNGD